MKPNVLEDALKEARFRHLSENTLLSFRDQRLDAIEEALAEAHLKLCGTCERRLAFLREDEAALDKREITEEDVAFVRKALGESGRRRQ